MKLLTLNFLTCAVKRCKQSAAVAGSSQPLSAPPGEQEAKGEATRETGFPLHVRDAELSIVEQEFNALFLRNIMPRLEWDAMRRVVEEVGLHLPPGIGEGVAESMAVDGASQKETREAEEEDEKLKKLHKVLLETQIDSGMLVCGSCGHQYMVKEGIPNFLLPPHLV